MDLAKKKKDSAPEAQNGTVASQGDKGPYIPALSMEDQSKKYDVNTTAEKVRRRDWLIRILALILLILLLILGVAFCTFSVLNTAGRFTVSLVPNDYGITLADNEEFRSPTLNLSAAPVENMDNITKEWILNKDGRLGDDPEYADFSEISSKWGENNGSNYLAYTFGVRNASDASSDDDAVVAYRATLRLNYAYKDADKAVRVMVMRVKDVGKDEEANKKKMESTIYAMPSKTGGVEAFATDKSFMNSEIVFDDVREGFEVGATDRFTVIIWLEGEDPECVNKIMGGEAKFSMQFEVLGSGETDVED